VRRIVSIVVLMLISSAVGFGVGRRSASDGLLLSQERPAVTVARYEGGGVGASDVQPVLAQLGGSALVSARRGAVEQFVRVRLLALAAEREGLHRSPDFLRRYQEELARLYVEKRFEEPFQKKLPTEGELKQFFEESREKLGRPERVRIAHVALLAPAADAQARAAKRAEAERILGEVRRSARDEYAFGNVAGLRSEDPRSRPAAGELPFLTREELSAQLGPEVAEVAFALKPGEIADRVVATAQGFQVVKLLAREAGREADYDEVRDAIRVRLTSERRDKAFQEFLEGHWQRAHVQVDEKELEAVGAAQAMAPAP